MTTPRLNLTRPQILAFRRHVGALDERLPRGRRSLRRAAWAGLQDSMPRAALLSIHARRGDRTVHLGGPIARPALGAALPRVRRCGARPRGLLAREAAGRWHRPADRGGPGRSPARPPRRPEGELRRGGERTRRTPQPAPVRRIDRHGRDPVGGRAIADRLDRAATRRSTRARLASSSRAGTCTSSVPPRPRRSPSGRGSPRGEASRRSTRSAGP